MKFRFGIFGLPICGIAALGLLGQATIDGQDTGRVVTMQVLVRDTRGVAVPGLTADDFIVTENGERGRVLGVKSLGTAATTGPASEREAVPSLREAEADRAVADTYVLVIVAPMSASGRNYSLKSLLRFLSEPGEENWQIALVDDEGTYIPYGQTAEGLRATVQKLSARVSEPQYWGGSWMGKASRAVAELAITPGRHAIIFVSDQKVDAMDVAMKSPPDLLRVWPSAFIAEAVSAGAAMYTIQGSGPGEVVPFGHAADSYQYSGSGQEVAEQIRDAIVAKGAERSDYLYAADETGGRPALDPKDAFARIAADGTGWYRISFEPRLAELDGAWHPISVSVQRPHAHVQGPRYYLAPVQRERAEIPAAMKAALQGGAGRPRLELAAHAWLFPSGSIHTAVLASDLNCCQGEGIKAGPKVQIFAQLVDDSMGRAVGSWLVESDAGPTESGASGMHWQREASIYPGSYTLRVIAMDEASGKVGTRVYSFRAHPLESAALRFSAVVMANGCVPERELSGIRRNLMDPMMLNGCVLAAPASGSFRPDHDPTVMARLYPPDQRFASLILKQWKAWVVVDGEGQTGKGWPLIIEPAEVRGLVAHGEVPLSQMHLPPGPHRMSIVFEVPKDRGGRDRIPLTTEFSIH